MSGRRWEIEAAELNPLTAAGLGRGNGKSSGETALGGPGLAQFHEQVHLALMFGLVVQTMNDCRNEAPSAQNRPRVLEPLGRQIGQALFDPFKLGGQVLRDGGA